MHWVEEDGDWEGDDDEEFVDEEAPSRKEKQKLSKGKRRQSSRDDSDDEFLDETIEDVAEQPAPRKRSYTKKRDLTLAKQERPKPYKNWEQCRLDFKAGTLKNEALHTFIVDNMVSYCFEQDQVEDVVSMLRAIMPDLEKRVQESFHHQVLKLNTGVKLVSHKCRRKDPGFVEFTAKERNPKTLIFYAAVMVLVYCYTDPKYPDDDAFLDQSEGGKYADWATANPPPEPLEVEICRHYANFMTIAMNLHKSHALADEKPVKLGRELMTDLVTAVTEGKGVKHNFSGTVEKYLPGTVGSSGDAKRRLEVFRREGKPPIPRPDQPKRQALYAAKKNGTTLPRMNSSYSSSPTSLDNMGAAGSDSFEGSGGGRGDGEGDETYGEVYVHVYGGGGEEYGGGGGGGGGGGEGGGGTLGGCSVGSGSERGSPSGFAGIVNGESGVGEVRSEESQKKKRRLSSEDKESKSSPADGGGKIAFFDTMIAAAAVAQQMQPAPPKQVKKNQQPPPLDGFNHLDASI